jgi:hypothetical protein
MLDKEDPDLPLQEAWVAVRLGGVAQVYLGLGLAFLLHRSGQEMMEVILGPD